VKYYRVARSRRVWLVVASLAVACTSPPPVSQPAPEPEPAVGEQGRAALALANVTPELPLGVFITDDTTRYPVVGPPSVGLAQQAGNGREGGSDSDYVGLTTMMGRWQFRPLLSDSGCRLVQVSVFMHVVTTLPQWLPPRDTPDSLVQQWTRFLDATMVHEHGHRNIALHTAIAILRTLQNVRELECPGIGEIANLHAQAAWDLGRRRQVDYDIATVHGATQGSRWPPPPAVRQPPGL
jgi:predicted secreted Zn-dependent protease